jgi:HemY protein
MRRLLLFVALTALLVAAAVWLADRPGEVTIHWQGWRVDTTVPVLVLGLTALLAVMAVIFRLLRLVLGAPGRFFVARRARRTQAGYRALSDGLAAVAAGNPRQARKLAHKADRLLVDHSLTGLLSAQAADLSGDEGEAKLRFETMVARPATAFLGLKGLLDLALKQGDRGAALDYARRAWALQPGTTGLAVTLFELQMANGQWAEAEMTLGEARRRKAMAASDLSHRRALVLYARANAAELCGNAGEALSLLLKAHRADPGFVVAAVAASRLLHHRGKERKAVSVIETAFRAAPHAALVEALLALAPAETALQRVSRLERLVRTNPAAIGHLALAEAALEARLWGQARTHAEKAVALRPGARAYDLMARLERGERKDEAAAMSWAAKAAAAPAEAAWVCGKCGETTAEWSILCPSCGAVDGLEGP